MRSALDDEQCPGKDHDGNEDRIDDVRRLPSEFLQEEHEQRRPDHGEDALARHGNREHAALMLLAEPIADERRLRKPEEEWHAAPDKRAANDELPEFGAQREAQRAACDQQRGQGR